MLTVNQGAIDLILEIAGNLFADVSYLMVIAIALPLGFWLTRKVIGLVKSR